MGSVAHYVEVGVPKDTAYGWWRGLTRLPEIFPDVESVTPVSGDDRVTHWKVRGPLGKDVEWDARIVEDVADTRIAWATVEGAGTAVRNAGAVRFDDHGASTGVEVSLRYDPPGGPAGEAVAKLFADPQDKVERALAEFKQVVEPAP